MDGDRAMPEGLVPSGSEFVNLAKKTANPWRPVPSSTLSKFWRMYRTEASIRACRNLLATRLFGMGAIPLNAKDPAKQVSEEFQDHVSEFYMPFYKDFLDTLWVQGFCGECAKQRSSQNLHHHTTFRLPEARGGSEQSAHPPGSQAFCQHLTKVA